MSLLHVLSDETIVLSAQPSISNRLKQLSSSVSPVLIAVSGESAAGKTTFLKNIGSIFKEATFIDADHYFNDISKEIQQVGGFSNLVNSGYESDAPDSFQLNQLATDLEQLKKNQTVKIPFYEMKTGESIPQAQQIQSAPVIFVAGICTLYEPVHELFDFKIYLQANPLEQRTRYFSRAAERGQNNVQEVYNQFVRVSQMAQRYVVPTKSQADVVLKGRLPQSVLKHIVVSALREIKRG